MFNTYDKFTLFQYFDTKVHVFSWNRHYVVDTKVHVFLEKGLWPKY